MMMRCPGQAELLLYALNPSGDDQARRVACHVRQCARCRDMVTGLRGAASAIASASGAAASGYCLDEMTVSAVAELGAGPADRDVVAHLATCADCREQLASVARLLRHPSVVAETHRTDRSATSRHLRWRVAGAIATALAAGLAFTIVGSGDRVGRTRAAAGLADALPHREPSVTATLAPAPLAPLGTVAEADTFRWTSVPRADRYRLTVFDREGTVVWEAVGNDTALALPVSIARRGVPPYFWKVEARTSRDRWVESELFEFTVMPNVRVP
jgi:hypothetical protein